ncbi:aldo/keto reductase [Microbispora triticiradicis]|uniref:Aldo/keto reductase n=2 Tax=Microbispora TaxID=2005 RepID=A0ABY3M1A5_9ACTN|nr:MULTISPECIES: aldo/keto reductase [Microbispora]TLP52833.1 aldo/keto reductase [Microbispora fusca]TYB62910.1 aldo/keto reductase [Microbispora tritici]
MRIALGTIPFGTAVDEETSFAILDRFVEGGGTILDTANNYPFWLDGATGDESEATIGRWLASRRDRDAVVISTKCGARPSVPGARTLDAAEGLSAGVVRAAIEGSLRRLGTDHVDVYWAHIDDRTTPLEETVAAFDEVVRAGKAREIGASNHATWRLERARALAAARGGTRYGHVQLRHSYLRPRPGVRLPEGGHTLVTKELLDYVRSEGDLKLWVYSSLLAGAYTAKPLPEHYDHPGTTRRLAVLDEVAGEIGATRNQVVLAWLRAQDILPIVGVSSVAQLEEVMADVKLDDDLLSRLDAPV